MSVSTPSSPRMTNGNLRAELTSFIGRKTALSDARRMMSSARCLTLIGPGGVGKTRMAVRLAANLSRNFDAVWVVEFGRLHDDTCLAEVVVETLDIRDLQGSSLSTLVDHLADHTVLVVFDNCEHVPRVAVLAGQLLERCPDLRIIATSRSPIGVPGEHLFPVGPLTTPGPDEVATPETATRHEAVRLFVERARAAAHGFDLTPDNTEPVMRLCRRLAGLPLAIELAAAKVRAVPIDEIVQRLGNQLFTLTTGGSPAAPDRQRTLRSTLDWSYALCSAKEKTMWRRLSVFPSKEFDLTGAEYVCTDETKEGIRQQDVIGLITALVDKSILVRSDRRYTQLAPIWEYGAGLLADSEDASWIQRRYTEWCMHIASQASGEWFSANQLEWVGRLTAERDNIRAAISQALTEPGHAHIALEIVSNLWTYWSAVFGSLAEARNYLSQGLTLDTEQTPTRAKALWVSGWLALRQGDLTDTAAELAAECQTLAEHTTDSHALAYSIHLEGLVAYFDGRTDDAIQRLHDARRRYQLHQDTPSLWMALCHLTMACGTAGDHDTAHTYGRQALTMAEQHSALLSKSCAIWALSYGQWIQGPTHTTEWLTEALRIMRTAGDLWGIAECLEALAWHATAAEDDEYAARLLGAAQRAWESIDITIPSVHPLAIPHDRCVTTLRERLGPRAYKNALRDGHINGITETPTRQPPEKHTTEQHSPLHLTARENEVGKLIAAGKTNREIARTLTISPRTVDRHVENILTKLGATKRTQIAAWISENNSHRPL